MSASAREDAATAAVAAVKEISPASIFTRGAVKVVIIVSVVLLAFKGVLQSTDVTAIYAAIIGVEPIEHAAAGVREAKVIRAVTDGVAHE